MKYCRDIIQRLVYFLLWKVNASLVLARDFIFLSTSEVTSVFTVFSCLPGVFFLH